MVESLKIMSLRIFTLFFFGITSLQASISYTPDEQVDAILNNYTQKNLLADPEWQSYLGFKEGNDSWTATSEEKFLYDVQCVSEAMKELQKINPEELSDEHRVSYKLFLKKGELDIEAYHWRYHEFRWNHMWGPQSEIAYVLTSIHNIESLQDALDYIERVKKVQPLVKDYLRFYEEASRRGIHPPHLVYSKIIQTAKEVISDYPFDSSEETNPIYLHFVQSLLDLDISAERKESLKLQLRDALIFYFLPAYEDIIETMQRDSVKYTDNNGVWALPEGKAYYAFLLRDETTTDLTPEEIHQLGLQEVDRIHNEMRKIMEKVGFEGTLTEFFTYLRDGQEFYFPDDDAGRQMCLNVAHRYIDHMKELLPQMFNIFPKADLQVKQVESYREKSTGSAFYVSPAVDGSRPGTLYLNLYSMRAHPMHEMESLLYHEGIPGHHMQLSIARELKTLPLFRKLYRNNAYTEGWALYCEQLPKEFGCYENPYSDFGRLNLELLRATRLVVDTGLHYKRWSIDQAVKYMMENTPNSEESCRKSVQRYLVMPAQAVSYKIGMIKILELRQKAKTALGDKFDLKAFHDVLLKHGALPMDMLEEQVDLWIESVLQPVTLQN
jgi:uncharacterized protein (DUF885 family)